MTDKNDIYDRLESIDRLSEYGKIYRDRKYMNDDQELIRVTFYKNKFYVQTYDEKYKMPDKIDKDEADIYTKSESEELCERVENFLG
jgi:hypothetical protein